MTLRETILAALHELLLALPATALRGDVLPERVPAAGLVILRDGDEITIDAVNNRIDVKLSESEIATRKAAWVQPKPRYTRGVQAKFAFNASSASKGAVLDLY